MQGRLLRRAWAHWVSWAPCCNFSPGRTLLAPAAPEMVGNEGENGIVTGLVVGLVAGNEYGEVLFRREPGHSEPHGVAARVGECGAASPRLAPGEDPAHGEFRFTGSSRGRAMKFLQSFRFDQLSFGRRKVGGDELGPVSYGTVDDASGADGDGIVGIWTGLDGRAIGCVPAGLVIFHGCAGRAEAGSGHPERVENLFAHQVFPGCARHLFRHVARDGVAGIGVYEFCAGPGFGRLGGDALKQVLPRAGGGALVLPKFGPEFILFERSRRAAPMGEELLKRHGLVQGVHGIRELLECLTQGLIPFQTSFIHEDSADHGGDRLGVRADVEAVRRGDPVGLAARAHTIDSKRLGFSLADDCGRHSRNIVLFNDRSQKGGNILRQRGLRVHADQSKAIQDKHNGRNVFHMCEFWLGYHAHQPHDLSRRNGWFQAVNIFRVTK